MSTPDLSSNSLITYKDNAARKQGFESWASYEQYCKVTDIVKAYPMKMIAMCDIYANDILQEKGTMVEGLQIIARENKKLDEENRRLREALVQIQNLAECSGLTPGSPRNAEVRNIAKSVLTHKPTENENKA